MLDRIKRQIVDRDHLPATIPRRLAGLGAKRCHLRPPAGRRAQVNYALAWLQNMMLVIDLDQLERGARTPSLSPRSRDVGVVEMALQPGAR